MFDRLIALLLRLYPAEFRRAYESDALQLIKDRARDERGALRRLRLLFDLAIDLCATSLSWRPSTANALARVDDGPRFDFIEPHRPRPEAMAVGTLTSVLMLATFTLLFQPRVFPPAPAQLGQGSGGEPTGSESGDSNQQVVGGGPESDARHALIELVATNLQERYVDRSIGRQLADALLAFEKNGQYASIATGPELAETLTADIYKTSRAIGIPPGAFVADVVYSARELPVGPPPPITEEMREHTRAMMIAQNCLFRTIDTLPRNIGYLKLNGFADASACQDTTKRAMASINNVDALIVDLQDNGGGYGETALQIAGYLFDRPSYLYDPRPNSPVPSHTVSPIPGNKLADKPVYLLTSSRTQSAAEYFAYNLKMLKRVTIVGERTAGHQHSGAFRRLDDHFGIGIQEATAPDNPYPVKGWEIIGIEPDVTVPRADALNVARTLAESRARRSR